VGQFEILISTALKCGDLSGRNVPPFAVRWQAKRDTALDGMISGEALKQAKAPSPLRSAGALQKAPHWIMNYPGFQILEFLRVRI